MTIQELKDRLRREGVKGNSANIKVPVGGVYATIDMGPTNQTMTALQTSTDTARSDLIRQIESSPGDYAPPVLYMLAKVLYQDGNVDDALFWFTAGLLRGAYDAMRCTDKSAASVLSNSNLEMPRGLFKAEMDDPDKYRMIADKVIQWDATTPYNYDCRWIALHGLKALQPMS